MSEFAPMSMGIDIELKRNFLFSSMGIGYNVNNTNNPNNVNNRVNNTRKCPGFI